MSDRQKPIAVLAGSRQQYDDWLRENGLKDRQQAVYVWGWEAAAGIEFSCIEKVGTWYAHKGAKDLYARVAAQVR